MRHTMTMVAVLAILTVGATASVQAQVLPGGGGGDCDAQCVTVYDINGLVIGHGCIGGGDRGRTNCVATVGDCTTDPCQGFALADASGSILAIATCQWQLRQLQSGFSQPSADHAAAADVANGASSRLNGNRSRRAGDVSDQATQPVAP